MKYCRVVIESPLRGRIYKKDFDPQHLFGPLVQVFASEMVKQSVVKENEPYRSLITPRYENTLIQNPIVQMDSAKAQVAYPGWLTLDFDGQNTRADDPLTYFTIELRFPESGLIYTQDLQILMLDYFWQNLQTAMLRMHVLQDDDQYIPRIYFRDDDEANFEQEDARIIESEGEELLIELIEVEDTAAEFPLKSPGEFNILSTQEVTLVSSAKPDSPDQQDGVQIFIAQNTLEALQAIARLDVQVEQGGVLVGHVYRSAQAPEQYLVEITDHIVAESASANVVELHYNFDSWLQQNTLLRERYPGKQIVGWYHTHLVQVVISSEESSDQHLATELFFSQDDHFMHRRFFSDRWYVAMVLGPQGNTAFFRWFGDKISAQSRYHVIQPAGAAFE